LRKAFKFSAKRSASSTFITHSRTKNISALGMQASPINAGSEIPNRSHLQRRTQENSRATGLYKAHGQRRERRCRISAELRKAPAARGQVRRACEELELIRPKRHIRNIAGRNNFFRANAHDLRTLNWEYKLAQWIFKQGICKKFRTSFVYTCSYLIKCSSVV
jgi:hypothetical protein